VHTNSRRNTAQVGWTRVAVLFLLACAAGCSKAPAGASTRLLTTIPDVRALPVKLAGQGWPVRLRGVVTYADHEWGRLFIQDQDAAVAVDISADHQPYAPGELVDVAGWTGAPDIAAVPLVLRPTIEVVQHFSDRTRLKRDAPGDRFRQIDLAALRDLHQFDELLARVIGAADDPPLFRENVEVWIDLPFAQIDRDDHQPSTGLQRAQRAIRGIRISREFERDIKRIEIYGAE